MTLHRPLVVALAVWLAVSACSVSTPDDDASGSSTAEAPSVRTNGVTDDTVKLGLAAIDLAKIKDQFGVDLGQIPDSLYPALVEAVNDDGGINGRRIELVERTFLPIGNEEPEQVCRELTEDEQVFAVVGMFNTGDYALCVSGTHETPYIGLWGNSEAVQEAAVAPTITVEGYMEDRLRSGTEAVIDGGDLDGATVGVLYDDQTTEQQIEEHIVAPLEEAGIDIASIAGQPPSTDAVAAGRNLDRILQRFEADGVDTVVTPASAGLLVPAIERTSWSPSWVFMNGQFIGDGVVERFGLVALDKLDRAVVTTPGATTDEIVDDPALQGCLDRINRYSDLDLQPFDIYEPEVEPRSQGYSFVHLACQLWDLTVAALEAAGDDLTVASLTAGLDDIGDLELVGIPDASISSDRRGAISGARLWTFDEERRRFEPVTPLEWHR